MKFSNRTIQILKNFATINQSIVFKPGNEIKTMSTAKTILARATIDSELEKMFAIYDLARFLSAVSLFDDPELTTRDKFVEIGSGSEKLNFVYSDASLIQTPPDKDIKLPTEDVQFRLTSGILAKTMKALGVLGSPEIGIVGDGDSIFLQTLNSKDVSSSSYKVRLGETDKTFRFIVLPENMKLLPGDYDVTMSAKGFSHFKGNDVEYWLAIEATSTFNN